MIPALLLALASNAQAEEQVEKSFQARSEIVADLANDRAGEDHTESFSRVTARASGRDGSRRWKIEAIGTHSLRWAEAPSSASDTSPAAWEALSLIHI